MFARSEIDAGSGEPEGAEQGTAPSATGLDAGTADSDQPEQIADESCPARSLDLASPEMLIVFDRSLSMSLNRRWEPSKQAVKAITRDFGGLMQFGMSLFPGSGGDCAEGRLDVPLGLDSSEAIASLVDQTEASGLTPTGPALSQALRILGDRSAATARPAYVLLVTDGEPNCHVLPLFPDTAQQDAARTAVRALRDKNIPTYVIGYQIDSAHQALMNDLAALGGTMRYRPVESGEQIISSFREISKDVVRCSFELSEAPDARRVRVEIDAEKIARGSDGWKLEGKTLTLLGAACATLKDGRGHDLSARLECGEEGDD